MHLIIITAILESLCLTLLGISLLPIPHTDTLPAAYLFFAGFSNTALICFLLNLLTVYPFHRAGLNKTAFVVSWSVFMLFSIIAVTDFKVYGIYRFHLNMAMLDLFLNGGGDVIAFSGTMWMSIIGYCVLVLISTFTVIMTAAYISRKIKPAGTIIIPVFILVTFLLCNITHAVSKGLGIASVYRNSEIIGLYYPLTSSKLFKKQPDGLTENATDASKGIIDYPKHPLHYSETIPEGKLPNIYMIYVDGLRADTLNSDNMPYLYEMARNNLNFTEHLSGGNATRNGIFTLFYGLPGSYWNRMLNANIQSIMVTALQDRGYEINAFAGAQMYKPEFDRTVFANVKNLRIESQGGSVSEKDQDAIRDFKSFLDKKTDRPQFAFIFLDKLHSNELIGEEREHKKYPTPWNNPNYLAIDKDFDRDIFFNLYKNVAHVIDTQLQDLFTYLQNSNLWDNSIVIVSADHGNEFNDNGLGYYGHNSNFTYAQLHVPLVIHWPGKSAQEYNHITTSYDLTATLLPEVLGVTNDTSDYTIGKSFFDQSPRDPIISSSYLEDAVIKKDYIIISNSINGIRIKNKNYRDSDRKLTEEDRKDLSRKLEIDRTYVHHD